ncbi:MAG TPA: 50S ribosomal protein L25/general stress protein Ctc [Actinomycetota bacterium]
MELKLEAEKRDESGKGAARKLRARGRVPAVLYGHGVGPVSVSVGAKDLYRVLHGSAGTNVLVNLTVDGAEHLALPREIQRDHVRGRYVHVDFLAVRRDEKVTVSVPVRVVGESPGVKVGGVVEHHLWELQVECLPGDVPDGIDADVSELQVGDSLRVSDIVAPEGVTVLTPPEESLLSVVVPQVRVVEEVAEVAEGEEAAPAEGEEAPAEEAGTEEGGEG